MTSDFHSNTMDELEIRPVSGAMSCDWIDAPLQLTTTEDKLHMQMNFK